ncbi:hypothetical protein Tco_0682014 [Tanacetum coccineum]|uniref:Uncharacterized protein n=1 Tax=Tanacetum coccineum TaxID=301880 RepID=A0ABQ4XRK4_9ASTR
MSFRRGGVGVERRELKMEGGIEVQRVIRIAVGSVRESDRRGGVFPSAPLKEVEGDMGLDLGRALSDGGLVTLISVISDDINLLLSSELSNKKDASTWDIMDLLCLDDTVAETLGMTHLQPDVNQLMVPVHHKRDRVPLLMFCLPCGSFFYSSDPFVSVEDYDNPDPADVVPENTTSGLEREGKIDASAGGGLTFSQLDDEARDAVL